jgi:hypothetical protein
VLVPDVSARSIEIRYTFAGAQLLLFGAILYPSGRIPTDNPDIVIVVKGPPEPIIVREKQRIAGIWMNAESSRFRSAPSFYAVASSRPISELVDERTAAIYELGLNNLQLSPGTTALPESAPVRSRPDRPRAARASIRKIPAVSRSAAESSTGRRYRSRARCRSAPTRPRRSYRRRRVLAVATRKIEIGKSGFERFVALAARRHSVLYGLTAVLCPSPSAGRPRRSSAGASSILS